MPLVRFEQLPDVARLWIFAAPRPLSDGEAASFLPAVDQFLTQWTAHKVPLATARDWRLSQFLFVAVDESAAGASGCSVDTLVRFMRTMEEQLGVRLTDNGLVWYRDGAGQVSCVSRGDFQHLADRQVVGPETVVFDNTVETTGALRAGDWEVPVRRSWHGRAFLGSTR